MSQQQREALAAELYPEDLYGLASLLSVAELTTLKQLRAVLDEKVAPHVDEHWEAGTFPTEIIQPLVDLDLMDPPALREAGEEPTQLYAGFRNYELSRTDPSVATFYNAQSGLFRTTVNLGGSAEQVAELEPKIRNWEYFGVFALTEPDHGSDIAGGLETTASFDAASGEWVINGSKRWIGGAALADALAVFARDTADSQVKCFLVPRQADGVTLTKIEGKTALRIMQNADIDLKDVRVPDTARLQNINSFKDVASCLRNMRSDVAWIATGAMAGAFDAARTYVTTREQFGKKLAEFQLIQEKLALMAANLTAALTMVTRLTQQQQEGKYRDENSAMAKMHIALRLRENVALAREICGGNGITLDAKVARFHADAEAIYSYEGTHEINSLILARALTGYSAFV